MGKCWWCACSSALIILQKSVFFWFFDFFDFFFILIGSPLWFCLKCYTTGRLQAACISARPAPGLRLWSPWWAPPTRFSSKVPLPTVGIAWYQILKYHSVCDQVGNLVVTFTIIYTWMVIKRAVLDSLCCLELCEDFNPIRVGKVTAEIQKKMLFWVKSPTFQENLPKTPRFAWVLSGVWR